MSPVFRFRCPSCNAAGVVNEGRLSLPRHTVIGSGRVDDKSWYRFECWNGGQFMLTPPAQQSERKTVTEEEYRGLLEALQEQYRRDITTMNLVKLPAAREKYWRRAQEQLAAIDKVKRQYTYDQQEEKLFEDVTVEPWSGQKFHYTRPGVIAEPKPDNYVDQITWIEYHDQLVQEWVQGERPLMEEYLADEIKAYEEWDRKHRSQDPVFGPLWEGVRTAALLGTAALVAVLLPVIILHVVLAIF